MILSGSWMDTGADAISTIEVAADMKQVKFEGKGFPFATLQIRVPAFVGYRLVR